MFAKIKFFAITKILTGLVSGVRHKGLLCEVCVSVALRNCEAREPLFPSSGAAELSSLQQRCIALNSEKQKKTIQ